MPSYDYKCEKCGHIFEAFQSIVDEPLKKCPECKKDSLRRLISGGGGLIFKGSGFYATDYKKKPPAESSKSPAEAPCAGCPKAEGPAKCPKADKSG